MSELVLPRFTGWAIPDDALEIIAGLLEARRPRLVVELGSGRSTIVLADVLRRLGVGRLVSLEHLPDFVESAREFLRRNDLDAIAEVRHGPIEEHGETGLLAPMWYARPAWRLDLSPIDALIVDGPPGHSAPYARDPAVPLLRRQLSAGALVILDDTNRSEEQRILRHWGLVDETTVRHSTGALTWGTVE